VGTDGLAGVWLTREAAWKMRMAKIELDGRPLRKREIRKGAGIQDLLE
jgi:hypothetical protein